MVYKSFRQNDVYHGIVYSTWKYTYHNFNGLAVISSNEKFYSMYHWPTTIKDFIDLYIF